MEWFHLGVLSQTSGREFSVPGCWPSKTLPVLHDARIPLPINVDTVLDARTAKTRLIDKISIQNSSKTIRISELEIRNLKEKKKKKNFQALQTYLCLTKV